MNKSRGQLRKEKVLRRQGRKNRAVTKHARYLARKLQKSLLAQSLQDPGYAKSAESMTSEVA